MLIYSSIISLVILIQLIFSFKSYINSGQNEFLYIGFSEVIQLLIITLISKAVIEDCVNISYQSTVFYFNLICLYYYFKCIYTVSSKSLTYSKVSIKHSSIVTLSTLYYMFLSCYVIMVIGAKNNDMIALCTTGAFFEVFAYLVPIRSILLWPFLTFQLVLITFTSILVLLYSSKKIVDLMSFAGLWLAVLLQTWLLAKWPYPEKVIPVIYVLTTITGLYSNIVCYTRENHQLPTLIKMIYLYKKGKLNDSMLKINIASYKTLSNNTRLLNFILKLTKMESFLEVDMKDIKIY